MNSYYLFSSGFVFLLNFIFAFIPFWTRKTENFGVTIPAHLYDRTDFKRMRINYALLVSGVNIFLFCLFLLSSFYFNENKLTFVLTTIIVVYIVASFLLYLPFHFKMRKLKAKEQWLEEQKQLVVIDTSFHKERLIYPNYLFIIPIFIVLLTTLYTYINYDVIQKKVPIHISFMGEVTYQEKSVMTVFLLPVTQLFLIGIFIFVNVIIKHAKQQTSASQPESSKKRNILFRRYWSLFMIISGTLMTMLLSFLQLAVVHPAWLPTVNIVAIVITIIILIGALTLSIKVGQGGSKLKLDDANETVAYDRDDDRYWKLGQFYFNRDDPSIFIEKRFGIGWTNNWAHPISWILIGSVMSIPIVIFFLINKGG